MNDRVLSLALTQRSNLRNESTKLNNKNIGRSKDSEQHMDPELPEEILGSSTEDKNGTANMKFETYETD